MTPDENSQAKLLLLGEFLFKLSFDAELSQLQLLHGLIFLFRRF